MAANRCDPLNIRCNTAIIRLTPVALFAPYMLAIYIGTLKLTPGKLFISFLLVPAIVKLVGGVSTNRRSFVAADFLMVALTFWLILAPISVSGSDVVVSAVSQALEFFGSYMIGRAYFYGTKALSTFGKALAIVVVVITAIGICDTLSHRYVVSEILAPVFNPPGGILDANHPQLNRSFFGVELIRATSTFDHPIHFGVFCAISICVLFYMQHFRFRSIGILFCALGCILALTSAGMQAICIAGALKIYDTVSMRSRWRWKALLAIILGGIFLVYIMSNNPLTWIITHLTFDAQTGFYRILVWDMAMPYVKANLWMGIGPQLTGNRFVDGSVDSIWLGKALSHGLPAVILLVLIGIAVIVPAPGASHVRMRLPDIDALCTGFSLGIVLFGLIGFTVYYWNGVWLYAALCLGIRASLKEYCRSVSTGAMIARNSMRSSGRIRAGALA